MKLRVGTKVPPDFIDKAQVIAMMMKHGIADNSSLTTLWVLKTQEIWDSYSGVDNVLDYKIVNLPFLVEKKFSSVFENGW
jgi:hypothetical protein